MLLRKTLPMAHILACVVVVMVMVRVMVVVMMMMKRTMKMIMMTRRTVMKMTMSLWSLPGHANRTKVRQAERVRGGTGELFKLHLGEDSGGVDLGCNAME